VSCAIGAIEQVCWRRRTVYAQRYRQLKRPCVIPGNGITSRPKSSGDLSVYLRSCKKPDRN
jgi:hypothetical protein